jgi:hypothetical protein
MATRSRIGIIDNRSGSVTSIYCHWDGYPETNGRILIENYTDMAKIQKLMKLGDLSSLGPEIGTKHDFDQRVEDECTAYGRDRGETQVRAQMHNSLEDYLKYGEEYNYLWDGQRWNCFAGNRVNDRIDLYNIKQTA